MGKWLGRYLSVYLFGCLTGAGVQEVGGELSSVSEPSSSPISNVARCTVPLYTSLPYTSLHSSTQHNSTQHGTARHNTTTQHSTTQHSTTQHNSAQHSTTTRHDTTPTPPHQQQPTAPLFSSLFSFSLIPFKHAHALSPFPFPILSPQHPTHSHAPGLLGQ